MFFVSFGGRPVRTFDIGRSVSVVLAEISLLCFCSFTFRIRGELRLPGFAMCTVWVRVEVRSASVVKLFPGRSLHLRAFAFPPEKPSRDFSVVQSCEAMRNVTRRNPWHLRECWKRKSNLHLMFQWNMNLMSNAPDITSPKHSTFLFRVHAV